MARLERLVQRGRQSVYSYPSSRASVWEFFANGYWRRVRERKGVLAISFLCLAVPTLLGGYWAWRDPGPASGLAPGQYQSVTQPRTPGQSLGLTVDEESAMASQIFTNNIGVTFLAFAGGLLLGLGTLYVLLQNGLQIGVVGGLAIGVRQRPAVLRARHRARGVGAELHRRRGRGRAPARMGDHRSRQPHRAEKHCAKKRAPRSRSCWALHRGSWSPGSWRVSSHRRAPVFPPCWRWASASARSIWGLVLWRGAPEPESLTAERADLSWR